MDNQVKNNFGRKIFFLYPHPSIRGMLYDLIHAGYEAYLLEEHSILAPLLEKYRNSMVFIDIDQMLKEKEWELFIKNILANPLLKEIRIGILSYFRKDPEIVKKYLMEIGVQCGFIAVDLNPEKTKQVIFKTLEANEARGQRQYIRAICNKKLDTFNTVHNSIRYEGHILNLSLTGMACVFSRQTLDITPRTVLKNIQLILRGARCLVSGVVMDVRKNELGEDIFIIMFNIKTMDQPLKEKIYNFISYCIQQKIQEEILELKLEQKPENGAHESKSPFPGVSAAPKPKQDLTGSPGNSASPRPQKQELKQTSPLPKPPAHPAQGISGSSLSSQ